MIAVAQSGLLTMKQAIKNFYQIRLREHFERLAEQFDPFLEAVQKNTLCVYTREYAVRRLERWSTRNKESTVGPQNWFWSRG